MKIAIKMKKRITNMLMFLVIGGTAMAQTVSVADVEVIPGTTASYALTINVGEGEYSGFQYQITFPATGFATPDAEKSTVNASWAGGTIVPGALSAGAGKVSALSMSNGKLPTGDFAVGTVAFEVDSDVAVGEYDVVISNFEFLSGTTRTSAPDVTFKVIVTDRITLDEESVELPTTMAGVNVKVKRTIKAGEWSTICLPFAMTEAQVKAAFGEDVELGDFKGYEVTKDDGGDLVGINVKFEDVTAIKANHPYIIKVSEAVSEFTVDGVDVEPEEDPMVNLGTNRKPKAIVGTYVAETEVPELCLFLSDNKFWYSTGATKMKAYRAYFDFNDVLTDVDNEYGAPVFISFGDNTTNFDLTTVNGRQATEGDYYDLNGRVVKTPQKGVYIRYGKKVIIK